MDTIEIIKKFVESLTFTVPVDNIIDNGDDTYTLELCKTYHQTTGCIVTIGTNYRVVDLVVDESITLKDIDGAGAPVISDWTVEAPKFFYGTPLDVNNEVVVRNEDSEDILPMVYLYETFTEEVERTKGAAIDRESSIRLFALAQNNFEDFTIDDHYNLVIRPMRNLFEELVNKFEGDGAIGLLTNYSLINWKDFGVQITPQGRKNKVFDLFTSGAEMRITLPILKDLSCSSVCKC